MRDHIARINFCASVCGLHEHACMITLLELIFVPVYAGYMSMHVLSSEVLLSVLSGVVCCC